MSPFPRLDDTIVAVATPPGRSGIGIVRLSGSSARNIAETFFESSAPFQNRLARFGVFREPPSKSSIDQVVVTIFNGPHSYTGEDVAEISCHGSPVTLNHILELLIKAGARRAEPGEFTLRAVTHGKLDLAQAEAVRDFINAQTDSQAHNAMLQMDGALAKRVQPEKELLVGVVAELEAGIDFAEDDVSLPNGAALSGRVSQVATRLHELGDTFRYGKILTAGATLAFAGKTNVGKSSIFNCLMSGPRSIVTDVPGTTRDVLTETIAINGVPIQIADTAGVRQTNDPIEKMGVDRTFETMAEVDLMLVVLDRSRLLNRDDAAVLNRAARRPHLVVINKQDQPAVWDEGQYPGAISVSALTGSGIDQLRKGIDSFLSVSRPVGADDCIITSARQQDALVAAENNLRAAAAGLQSGVPHEMVLVDLYAALSSIGELTGEVTTDDILDRVFSTFCIGK